MACVKLRLVPVVLACVLSLAASGNAQNITNPLANITAPNVTAPVTVNPFTNATIPPVVNGTATPSNVSNATLAMYRAVRSQSLALLGALQASNIVGVANYVTPDVQLFLPNTTGPVTLKLTNVTTLLPFVQLLTPPAGTSTSVNSISELYFYIIDGVNVAIVDEFTAGQLGNLYFTAFWSLTNSTASPINGSWLMNYATIIPAPSGAFIPQLTPLFVTTPNITLLPPFNPSNINVNGTNQTATRLNSTLPTNVTIQRQVIAASNALQVALGNITLSSANVSGQFFAPWLQLVLPGLKSPTPWNLSDPTSLAFLTALRGRNATGTATPQVAVAYRQLNTQAGVLTTLLPALPAVGDVYLTQLWQYLNTSYGLNTTTGVNTTIPTNSTRSPLAKSWQLTLAAVNLAPNSAAFVPIPTASPTPDPSDTPGPSNTPSPTAEPPPLIPTILPPSPTESPSVFPPPPIPSAPPPPFLVTPAPKTSPPSPEPFVSPPGQNTTSKASGSNVGIILGASLGATAVVFGGILVALLWVLRARKRRGGGPGEAAIDKERGANKDPPRPIRPVPGLPSAAVQAHNALGLTRLFAYRDIRKATNGFSDAALLGAGAFGRVYRATFPDGNVLAVKELRKGSAGSGESEFLTELATIARVRHRNLVTLVGYCISNKGYHLVLDFAPNGNLSSALSEGSRTPLSWKQRLIIATGAARGLSYLHNDMAPSILHRDIKSANILLDENLEALVADFGLAKLMDNGLTHHSTIVRGTYGYVAPEYAMYGKVSKQSDVYSFGVVLLELLTGRRAVETMPDGIRCNLVDAVARQYHQPLLTIDPKLRGQFSEHTASQLVVLASACTAREETQRPQMSHVFRELEDISQLLDTSHEYIPDVVDESGGSNWFGRRGQSRDGIRNESFPSNSTDVWSGQGESSGSGAGVNSMTYEMSMIRDGR